MIQQAGPLIPHRVPSPPKPNYDTDPITKIFQYYADNPQKEIAGRFQWNYRGLDITEAIKERDSHNQKRAAKGKKPRVDVRFYAGTYVLTMCGITQEALMVALSGRAYDKHCANDKIEKLKSVILAEERSIDENHWTVYSISISGDIGHAFLILQAKLDGKISYKMYQSYLDIYTFKDCLNKFDHTLTLGDIDVLVDEIQEYVKSPVWNDKISHLFTHFFHVPQPHISGSSIHYKRHVSLQWKKTSRQSLKDAAEQFYAAFPPNLVFSIKPGNQVDYKTHHIFRIYKRIAANYLQEIMGRRLWAFGKLKADLFVDEDTNFETYTKDLIEQRNLNRAKNGKSWESQVKVKFSKAMATSCGRTLVGCLASHFGKDVSTKNPAILFEGKNLTSDSILEIKTKILENEKQIVDENSWFVYGFAIDAGRGHGFTIIQALKNQEVVYKMYQSYENEYSINDYLDKYNNTYTNAEIFQLMEEIVEYVEGTHWNTKMDHLFSEFFRVKPPKQMGEELTEKAKKCVMMCGRVTRDSFEKHAMEFKADFPSFVKFIPPN